MTTFTWTQPCCENCWWREHSNPPKGIPEEHREPEICVFCGAATMSGLYVRSDPETATFPTRTK